MTKQEIQNDSESFDTVDINCAPKQQEKVQVPSLPGECINLMQSNQIEFYKDDKTVQQVYNYAVSRGLMNAVNTSTALYACLKDETHKGRLILPFFDASGKIVYYQSRSVDANDVRPKYMSKIHGDRAIFNFNNIDNACNDVFVFEGPIDCCFVKNGIAVAGIQEKSMQLYSSRQQMQINSISGFYNFNWVLDSQWLDNASRLKTQKLIDAGETVYIWPKNIGTTCKDFNDVALKYGINSISHKFIKQHCVKGLQAEIMLKTIN
jgi:hypothetical protein